MTSTEAIQRAIQKAIKNGYKFDIQYFSLSTFVAEGYIDEGTFVRALAFDPEFAKAFFGDHYHGGGTWYNQQKSWEAHLQQMVLSKDPLEYLERHL